MSKLEVKFDNNLTKELKTSNLKLRKFHIEDYKEIYKNWASLQEVTQYVTWDHHKSDTETYEYLKIKLEKYQKNEFFLSWVVILLQTNELIGEISTVKVDSLNKVCEIGYVFSPKHWNKGYASEALNAVVQYIKTELKFTKIKACHMKTNIASSRVLKKCGFKLIREVNSDRVNKLTNERENLLWYEI